MHTSFEEGVVVGRSWHSLSSVVWLNLWLLRNTISLVTTMSCVSPKPIVLFDLAYSRNKIWPPFLARGISDTWDGASATRSVNVGQSKGRAMCAIFRKLYNVTLSWRCSQLCFLLLKKMRWYASLSSSLSWPPFSASQCCFFCGTFWSTPSPPTRLAEQGS